MSGIGPSIGGQDYGRRGPSDPSYLIGGQRDKNQDAGKETLGNPKSKLFALVAATFYLKKYIDQFLSVGRSLASSINTEKILVDLAELKKILLELRDEDKSHVPEYTQRLSLQWQKVADNCLGTEDAVTPLDPLSTELMQLIREIHSYPPGEDHTLGYYLTEHAGQEWIPFPFMNMLLELHEQSRIDPDKSVLSQWIKKLDTLLGTYK